MLESVEECSERTPHDVYVFDACEAELGHAVLQGRVLVAFALHQIQLSVHSGPTYGGAGQLMANRVGRTSWQPTAGSASAGGQQSGAGQLVACHPTHARMLCMI